MASIYARGARLWASIKDPSGKWTNVSTPYSTGQEDLARRYAKRLEQVNDERRLATTKGPATVKSYAAEWLAEREQRGVRSARDDRARLEHAYPHVGHLRLDEVEIRHVRDMVRALRQTALAPRTIRHVFSTLRTMFENALIDGVVQSNPVKAKRGELPARKDADPEWRSEATFTTAEVERLISASEIPPERRVQYALKAIAGLRHGEASALCWRHYQPAEPLARLTVAQAFDSRTGKLKSTKTERTHQVPVHPALAKVLAAWKLSHWERVYGRPPTDDDFIVPARTMRPVNNADASHAFATDLEALGLRVRAGSRRNRGGHDLRAWFQTQTVEDGADSMIIDRVVHAPPATVAGGYSRFSWNALCREVGKLRISAESHGNVLELSYSHPTAEETARKRWRNLATPAGFESGGAPSVERSTPRKAGGTGAKDGRSRMPTVGRLPTAKGRG